MERYPTGWKTVKLESVARFFNGKPLESRVCPDGNTNLITLDSVDIKGQLKRHHKKIDADTDFLKAGDIVSVLSDIAHGYLLGLSAVIPVDNQFVLNQRMGLLRTTSEIDPYFLRLFLNYNQGYFRERGQGTSQRHIYKRDFYDFDFSYPPLTEQKAIAKALSDIDELIDALRIEISKLELLLEAKKDFFFSFANTKSWKTFEIWELGILSTATRKQSNFDSSSNFVILDMGSVSDRGLILETKYIQESQDLLSAGDLVIPKDDIGGGNIIGKAVHVSVDDRYVLGDHVFKLSVNRKLFNPEFTRYILNSKDSNKRVLMLVAGSAQLGLPKSSFLSHQLSFPDLEKQIEICDILNATEDSLKSCKQNLHKYECIKQGMAHDLLTGKVRLV
jgi:type I restriction enzyme S subunit